MPVRYRRRIGKSKVSGTISGSMRAGYKILWTIFRYELLMQLKSARFKGLCVLLVLVNLGFYQNGVRAQEMPSAGNFADDEIVVFYLIAAVFAGLFSIGRVRKTGMHSILMVRPFATFTLVLGQMLAALVSLLILVVLLFFPAGFILRWHLGLEFPLLPFFYLLLFYLIPGACCVLAFTIWIRTCFKHNVVALIVLGLLFTGMMFLANSDLLNSSTLSR